MKSDYQTLRVEKHGDHVLIVSLNRPEVANALNTQMGRDLLDLWTGLIAEPGAAAAAAGADGLIIEVHPEPDTALSDGPQSLTLEGFEQLMIVLERVLEQEPFEARGVGGEGEPAGAQPAGQP